LATADAIRNEASARIGDAGGALYGIWRSQIGLPRDTITVITAWSDTDSAIRMSDLLHDGMETVETVELDLMSPTLRPLSVEPPVRQGNFAFRWFEMLPNNFEEFLELCETAWPDFESSYDSQVIGLWRVEGNDDGPIRTLLMTRRPNLAMWERSKIPESEVEQAVRKKLNRRYDLCDWTNVYTTTLITAEDEQDETRWT
jgi:hypothetical protein|tara:strand:+ start:162 stop:761 length:600 start_codon:yes stop_codon:yes gene_type:complete